MVLLFVGLAKFRKPPEKKDIGDTAKMIANWKEKSINMLSWYWTLGRYDASLCFKLLTKKRR